MFNTRVNCSGNYFTTARKLTENKITCGENINVGFMLIQ